ncbi:ATP-binding protein [Salinirubellus salinus]|uniref:histidine kinase n=1 Tax=Salinirubellus salinus TaxID=1364945 RepID=A0A9E7R5J8_9EURY|nr:ATP-binding protein [Salinirubellus salinus]UWM56219.1 ATP-binding protein [Salinirubellus salinus]
MDVSTPSPLDDERLPPLLLGLFGAGLFAVALWNFRMELRNLSVTLPPIAAFAMGLGGAMLVGLSGVFLHRTDLGVGARWRVALLSVGGGALFSGALAATMLIRSAEGRPVGEPQFALLVATSTGALAGVVVGLLNARARNDAERAERARDRFELLNSMLRHDVLNAMMIVQARAEVITDDLNGREREYAETIETQTEEVVDLVERTRAVLDVLGEGETYATQPTDVAELAAQEAETLAQTREVDVSVDTSTGALALADDLAADVFANVLSNAVEHHDRERPHVEVTATTTDESVEVRIADDGPGIPDDIKATVFRRDHRGLKDSEVGSGFGLFFVDTMMDAYGGTVTIEDNDPRGAVFVLRFRRAN